MTQVSASMDYGEWEATVPQAINGDPLGKVKVYRLALYLSDLSWQDTGRIIGARDVRSRSLADQLHRAVGSIGANIAEGYSRSSGKDRAHFYEYALGSARESRDWYYKARHFLSEPIVAHRHELLAAIIRMLLVSIPDQRQVTLREESGEYFAEDLPTPDMPTRIPV